MTRALTNPERFHRRYRDDPSGCWLWTGSRGQHGYGLMPTGKRGGRMLAHRYSYELHVGPIPDGLVIDHLCRTPLCVNPAHLEPVTIGENVMRGTSEVARNPSKTECPLGHPYDAANTYVGPTGYRKCRACRRERWQKARAA